MEEDTHEEEAEPSLQLGQPNQRPVRNIIKKKCGTNNCKDWRAWLCKKKEVISFIFIFN